ncbi:unnamed protein product [Blepharisma stoltei]|uniref:ATP-dependent RNA helicase n=1 Tax=Blepharisma stoltei TaxID=1481888 RepID=A0AAU9J976_9CILI|nr:unnamed protein product [Blepharisma stoltei]
MNGFEHSDAYLEASSADDRYIIVYTLLKLGLITGKVMIYTNTAETGYRLKLFLEEFHIKSLLLNYEHPKSTRHLMVTNFVNHNDVLVVIDPDEEESQNKGCKRHKIFKCPVSVLINFDFPSSISNYRKRVSDVSDDINTNMSILSLILQEDLHQLEKLNRRLEKKEEKPVEKLGLKMEEFEKFRYRCEDILRTVTKKAVHNARMNDVKKAILATKEVKDKFNENPQDKKLLAEAKKKNKPKRYLASVPDYLLPAPLKRKRSETTALDRKKFEEKLAKRQHRAVREVEPGEKIEETPESIAWEDLPPTSNRKLWKIRHHMSLKGGPRKIHKKN